MRYILLIVVLAISHLGFSGLTPASTRLSSEWGSLIVGNVSSNGHVHHEDAIVVPSGDINELFSRGYVTVGVDHHYLGTYISAMNVYVKLKITTRLKGVIIHDGYFDFEIEYTPGGGVTIKDKQTRMFEGVDEINTELTEVKVNNQNVTELPKNLYIDLDILKNRIYRFTTINNVIPLTKTLQDSDCDGVDDELIVSWIPVVGVEEYQLEWTYVNNYGEVLSGEIPAASLQYDFRHNATRVTTADNKYAIRLIYGKGYLNIRIRGVGRDFTNPEKFIYGVWSAADAGNVLATTYHKITTPFNDLINWQYSSGFAEEGKKKEVIGFSDGTLRSRQQVTHISTDNTTIVGETYYDHQGRGVVQVLPVPVDKSNSCGDYDGTLKYYESFNKTDGKSNITPPDFDNSPNCTNSDFKLSNSSGSAYYYSEANWDKSGENAYIPDAKKYPYTKVEYMPDNTGRIRRQSGVGEDFKLGSGKETRYYYGKPDDIVLKRLFGNDAGYSVYYQKNMVVDGNGQVSLSYIDNDGKVVATSLAGNVPVNLEELPSVASSSVYLTEDLIDYGVNGEELNNQVRTEGDSRIFSETFLVAGTSVYTFNYSFQTQQFSDPCLNSGICFDCVYDLEIRILDDCGVDLAAANNLKKKVGNFSLDGNGRLQFNTTCESPVNENDLFSLELSTGSYRIEKILTVNDAARNYYLQQYFSPANNQCIRSFNSFLEEANNALDHADCNQEIDCDVCLSSLGSLSDYLSNHPGATAEDYDAEVDFCRMMCPEVSLCTVQRELMLEDVSPGGQYGSTDIIGDLTSIYVSGNVLLASWQPPKLVRKENLPLLDGYYEEDFLTRTRIPVTVSIVNSQTVYSPAIQNPSFNLMGDAVNGYYCYPEALENLSDFLAYWTPSWANSLLYFHPEYNYYRTCLEMNTPSQVNDTYTSESFDLLLSKTDTWAKAVTNGFIKSNYASISNPDDRLTDWFVKNSQHPWDPFVHYSASQYNGFGALLEQNFENYLTWGANTYSAVKMAAMMTRCPEALNQSSAPGTLCMNFGMDVLSNTTEENTALRNDEWNRLKGLYFTLKQEYVMKFNNDRTINHPDYLGYNGCIGNENFNILEDGFSDNCSFNISTTFSCNFFDTDQPCNFIAYTFFKDKRKRFGYSEKETSQNYTASNYAQNTGKCPSVSLLGQLISELHEAGQLYQTGSANNILLNNTLHYQPFTNALNTNAPNTILATNYYWQGVLSSGTAATVNVSVKEGVTQIGTISLTIPEDPQNPGNLLFSWSQLNKIVDILPTQLISGVQHFKVKVKVFAGGTYQYHVIDGQTTFAINSCTFEETCAPNELFDALEPFLHTLISSGDFDSHTAVSPLDVMGSTYSVFFWNGLINTALLSHLNIYDWDYSWYYNSTAEEFILKNEYDNKKLIFTVTAPTTAQALTLLSTYTVTDLKVTGSSTFDIKLINGSNQATVSFQVEREIPSEYIRAPFTIGKCSAPENMVCSGESYQNHTALSNFTRDILLNFVTNQNLSSVPTNSLLNINPFESAYVDPSLFQQLSLFANTGGIYTQYSYTTNPQNQKTDKLELFLTNCQFTSLAQRSQYITNYILEDCHCGIELQMTRDADSQYDFSTIQAVSDIIPYGDPEPDGSYMKFIMIGTFMGAEEQLVTDTIFGKSCVDFKICEEITEGTFVMDEIPLVDYTDPCEVTLDMIAYTNASNAYGIYIDSLNRDFITAYNKKCMATHETLTKAFYNKEYHFTLYYYDRAGNLIRTIPPEGVEQLDITSSASPLCVKLNNDLQNNTKTVVTNHRLATTYEYNSLNQLIRQTMPDHETMDLWTLTAPNGLPKYLNTTAIQMVTENIGYLTGIMVESGKPARGHLYKTTDGGENWTRINNSLANKLVKVVSNGMISLAISEEGVLLRSSDNGLAWDMVNINAVMTVSTFNDIIFDGTDVYLLSNSNIILKSTDSGVNFTQKPATLPSVPSGFVFKGFRNGTVSSGTLYLNAIYSYDNNYYSVLLKIASTIPATALEFEPNRFTGIKGMETYGDHLTIYGESSLLNSYLNLSAIDVILEKEVVEKLSFETIISLNKELKLALIRKNNTNYLRFTVDGAKTWSTMDELPYKAIKLIKRETNYISAFALTEDNSLNEIVLFNNISAPYTISEITSAAATADLDYNIQDYTVINYSDGYRKIYLLTDDNKILSSQKVTMYQPIGATAFWQITTYSGSMNVYNMSCYRDGMANTNYLFFLTSGGAFNSVKINETNNTTATSNVGGNIITSHFITGYDSDPGTNSIYLLQNLGVNRSVVFFNPVNGNSSTLTSLASGNYKHIKYNQTSLTISTIDGDVSIYDLFTSTFRNIRNVLRPIHDLSSTLFAAGDNGRIFQRINNKWQNIPNDFTDRINSVSSLNTSEFYIAGNRGLLQKYASGSFTDLNEYGISDNFLQIKAMAGATPAEFMALSDDGKLVYRKNNQLTIRTVDPDLKSFSSGFLNKLIFTGAKGKIFTGSLLHFYMGSSFNISPVTNIFGPGLYNLHFRNEHSGVIVGDKFFMRKTADGGTSWSVNKSSLQVSAPNTKLKAAWSISDEHAIVAGENYIGAISGNTVANTTTSVICNDIKFVNANFTTGYLTQGTTVKKLSYSISGNVLSVSTGSTVITASATFNALHCFQDGSLMAVGTSSAAYYYNAQTSATTNFTSTLPAGLTLNDVYFHDSKTGYVVGNNGKIFRSKDVSIHSTNYTINSIAWVQKNNDRNASSVNIMNTVPHINTIAFSSRYKGLLGGDFQTNESAYFTGKPYVLLLSDESEQYGTRFFYDALGRIVVSQNSRQYKENKFSYTLYDGLNRVYEAGEKTENNSGLKFSQLFGQNVGGVVLPSVINTVSLQTWVNTNSGARKQVTRSYYDQVTITGLPSYFSPAAEHIRKRIVHVTYENVYDGNDQTYDYASHFDYDIHGNVKMLVQDYPLMSWFGALNRFKRFDYTYDLISGNVHRVSYQTGQADQWHHAYLYDADNRITEVYTSKHTPLLSGTLNIADLQREIQLSMFWEKDASYNYYKHGPLARTELGEEKVQGIDYVYNLQGWIKAVNSNSLNKTYDPGADGQGLHEMFAKDAFGYSLHYYQGDYKPISTSTSFIADQTGSDLTANSSDLYNGNIARMVTTITNPTTREVLPLGNAYKYDQLNRIKKSRSFSNLNLSNNSWGYTGSYNNKYYNAFTYDASGNIKTQARYNASGTAIDRLNYHYYNQSGKMLSNRLYHVKDSVAAGTFPDDIDDMTGAFNNTSTGVNVSNNYSYDGEGRLIKDVQEGIQEIKWRVDGKIDTIFYTPASGKNNLIFEYDPMGRRVAKHVVTQDIKLLYSDIYMLDAQGNTMAVYKLQPDEMTQQLHFTLEERNIYGSARLGVLKESVNMLGVYSPSALTDFYKGNKLYELNNHLGNVLTVISDKPVTESNAEILKENDFSEGNDIIFTPSSATTSIVVDNGRLKFTTLIQYNDCGGYMLATTPGKVYRLSFKADLNGQGGISAYAYDNSISQFLGRVQCYSNGNYVMEFMAKSSATNIVIESYSNFLRDFYIDDIKIEELQPLYANDFSSNYTPFTSYGGTLSLVGGRLKTSVSVQWGNARHTTLATQPGVKYRVSYIIDLNGQGAMKSFARDWVTGSHLIVTTVASNGNYYFEFTATGNTTEIAFEHPTTTPRDFYIDNVFVTYQQNTNAPQETSNSVEGFMADIRSGYDYSPFGVMLDGRTFEKKTYEKITQVEETPVTPTATTVSVEDYIHYTDFEEAVHTTSAALPVTYSNYHGWTNWSNSTLSTEYRSSSNWLKINSANAGAGANKYLILEPSTQYQLTFTADKASVSYFAIVVATLSSTNSLSIFATQNVTANGLQTFTFTTPSSIPMNVVMIQLRQAAIYYIDNFAIKKVSPSYVLEIGDFESGAQVANTVMDYYDEWYNRPNHLIAVSQNNSMDRVRITNGDPFDCLRRYVSVTPNQQYTFRGKIVGAQGGNVRVMRMASGSSSMTLVTYQMITTNDGYVQFNFTPTQNQVLITVNAPGTYYLEDVAVYKTANQTKYTPTTHEKVLPTFTNATNMSQYGATVQSSPSASSWGSSGGYSAQQINKGDYIQFEIGSDALTNYYRPAVGISYTPSGKDMGMDYNWYFSGSSGEYQIYTAGGSRTRYITPYTLQNGNRYKIWRNNGNVEFYINDVLNRSFQDMYPDRPMYLEIAFGESNKKVENLYIYKEVVKTSNVVETTHLVAKGDYRYAFQGQERDDEIKGRGKSYNFEYRMHDSRLGRLFAIDPLYAKYPWNSPYAFSENRVIDAYELEGAESLIDKEGKIDTKYYEAVGNLDVLYGQQIVVYKKIGLPIYVIRTEDMQRLREAGYGVEQGGRDASGTQFNPERKAGVFATVFVGGAPSTSRENFNYGTFNSAKISRNLKIIKNIEDSGEISFSGDDLRGITGRVFPKGIVVKPTGSRGVYPRNTSGLVSENFEAPSSLGEVAAMVRVEYSIWQSNDARRAASHAGMEVTITNSKGDILAHGYGGEQLNFNLKSNEKFNVSVKFSGGADIDGGGADIDVNMQYSKTQ